MIAFATRPLGWLALCALASLHGCSGQGPPSSSAPPSTAPPSAAPLAPPTTREPAPTSPPPSAAPPPPTRIEERGRYRVDVSRDCDGWPHVALTVPRGLCVGLVAHRGMEGLATSGGPFRPRTIVEDPVRAGVFWIVDSGGHRDRGGRLYRMDTSVRPPSIVRVVDRMNRPHQGAIGPDGWLYVGEVDRVVRLDPARFERGASEVVASLEVVISDLPTQIPGRDRIRFHPLSAFVFTPEWDLVLNRGSATDHCQESIVAAPAPQPRCHDEADDTAAVVRYARSDDASGRPRWGSPRVIARGLRNSVALVAHASGTILQGENAVDFPENDRPSEELNVLAPIADRRAHHGWPYCYDRDRPDERWARAGFSCDVAANADYAPPLRLLPPHGAPLGMTYAEGAHEALRGRLLIVLHGYRPRGHRIVALRVDDRGMPVEDAALEDVVAGWDASDTGPKGTPVSVAIARDQSLFIVEDNNGTVLRLAPDAYAGARATATGTVVSSEIRADAVFTRLHRDVLGPRCAHCHEPLRGEPDAALGAITREGWLREDDGEPLVWQRVRPGATRRMPLDGTLPDEQLAAIRAWLDTRRQ